MDNLKEEVEKIKKVPGNVKGEVFNTLIPYIREREGDEGVKKVLKRVNQLGILINLEEIKPLKMYPGYMPVVTILVAKDTFNWSDDDVFEMGYYALRLSFMFKLFLKNLVSLETLFKQAPAYWEKHYDFGELISEEINKKEKYLRVITKGGDFHPVLCKFHAGYFKGLLKLVVNSKNINIEETKCVHRGDEHHEYVLTWE